MKLLLKNLRQIASEDLDSLAGHIPLTIFPDNSFLLDMWMSQSRSSKNLSPVNDYIHDEVEGGSPRSNQYLLSPFRSPHFLLCFIRH